MKRLLLTLLAVTLMGSSMLWAEDAYVRGHVYRFDTLEPVANASVVFTYQGPGGARFSATTNKLGYYDILVPMPVGWYDCVAKKTIDKIRWTDAKTVYLNASMNTVDFYIHPGYEP
jgi:hypothetical protein